MLDNSLKHLKDMIGYLVDSEFGIIHSMGDKETEPGAPNFFRYYALASNTRAFSNEKNFEVGGGVSIHRSQAMAKAIGEAIERYCSAIYDPLEMPLFSYDTAPFPSTDPSEFALYRKEQFNSDNFYFVPFDRSTQVRWTSAYDLLSYEETYIPASMIYVPYHYEISTGEGPIVQPISTGLACHSNVFKATISAICEVIERDAFMITWLAMLSRSKIIIESLSDANTDLVNRFTKANYSITIFDITTDIGVPTILSVAKSNSPELPPLAFAASTALNPEEAVRKSLEELEHTRYYCQNILEEMPPIIPDVNYRNIVDQKSHLNFWSNHANSGFANFIFESEKYIDINDLENLETGIPKTDLKILLHKVKSIGHKTLLRDVTTSDVLDLGFRVIRAVIPGFHPLFVGHNTRALGGYRLWNIPQKLGYKGIKYGEDNPYPHPYP